MKLLAIFPFLLLAAACAEPVPLETSEQSIINGRTEDSAPYKAIVSLGQFCTGTFVHPRYVMTAAHCLPSCSSLADRGCIRWSGENVQDGTWLGMDGPRTIMMNDGLTGSGGNSFVSDFVWFATAAEYDGVSPPDVAILHVDKFLRTPVIPIMPYGGLPTSGSVDDNWQDRIVQVAGYSDNNLMDDWRRRVGTFRVTGSQRDERYFELDDAPARACGGDSGGPTLWQEADNRLVAIGVESMGTDCTTTDGYREYQAFIPRGMLNRVAATDPLCTGMSWDQCVAAYPPVAAPTEPRDVTVTPTRDAVIVNWTDDYPPGTDRVRISRSPAFPPGIYESNALNGQRRTSTDAWTTGTDRTRSYTYTVCSINTNKEEKCAPSVTYTPPIAIAPFNVTASAPNVNNLLLHYETTDNGQMESKVRIYRNGVTGYREKEPLGQAIDYPDAENVYAYQNYTFTVCTVSKVNVEACASASTNTYGGIQQCPRNKILCGGTCKYPWECDYWE